MDNKKLEEEFTILKQGLTVVSNTSQSVKGEGLINKAEKPVSKCMIHEKDCVCSTNLPKSCQNLAEKPYIKVEESEYVKKEENDEESVIEDDKYSRADFDVLNDEEKDDALKSMAKVVKRLRRKVRNLEHKFSSNAGKVVNKYIHQHTNSKRKPNVDTNLNLNYLCKSLKILKDSDKFEYEDQKNVIENFIELIADEKLSPDSINFKKICTQIRLFLQKDKVKYVSKKGQKITFSFPEKDVNISASEYELYSKYKDREDIIRTALGVKDDTMYEGYPEQINFDSKRGRPTRSPMMNYQNINERTNKPAEPTRQANIENLLTLGMCPNRNNIQNLLMNSIYSNLLQTMKNQNNFP